MDNKYVKMCESLERMQEELRESDWDYRGHGWCPKHKNLIGEDMDGGAECDKNIYTTHNTFRKKNKCFQEDWIALPDSDWLMEKLGDRNWRLIAGKSNYYYAISDDSKKEFWGYIPKEALLKLYAYECYGLTWSDDKECWEKR